jgi:hypothetical protein
MSPLMMFPIALIILIYKMGPFAGTITTITVGGLSFLTAYTIEVLFHINNLQELAPMITLYVALVVMLDVAPIFLKNPRLWRKQ